MTITKIPVRTVFDNSNNPVGLAEFQVGEVIAIAQGGTSANTVANARVNLNITDANIRSLFSVSGGGSYSTSNGVITIDSTDLTPFAKTIDLTTANVIELTNLYFTTARANTSIDNRVNKTFVDNLGVDATTLDGIDSTAFALDTDLTTANVAEVTNLYFTDARARVAVSQGLGISYDNSTGIISANVTSVSGRTGAVVLTNVDVAGLTTANVVELTNLYFTDARARESISASGSINYSNSTGVISFTQGNTDTIDEGSSNLYFTNARSIASLVGQAVSIGEATITGNLFVLGNVVEFNTETLVIEDKNIVLANGSPSSASSNGAGITIDGASATLLYLSENDNWQFNKNLDVLGSIAATGNITSPFFFSESDIILKEEISPIKDPLKKLLKLVGVDFIWKSSKQKAIGVIAQNVEKILPEIVGKSSSGFKTVQYDSLIPLLIEAIKEQQKQIDDLRKKVK